MMRPLSQKATTLNTHNFEDLTEGKLLFVRFCAPWVVSCKFQHAAWVNLSREFKDAESVLIGDADCDESGLCERYNISIMPTILYGDAKELHVYDEGSQFVRLKAFVKDNLPSFCTATRQEHCTPDQLVNLARYLSLNETDMANSVSSFEHEISSLESEYEAKMANLQNNYEKALAGKRRVTLAALHSFDSMRAVFASRTN